MESKPFVIRLDVFNNVLADISSSPVMKEIYGDNVLQYLGMFSIGTDIKVADSGQKGLSKEQEEIFKNELNNIMLNRMKEMSDL